MKTSGVTKVNYKLEKKYNLWDIIVSIEEAQKIADWFCSEYNLEKVIVKFSKSKHWYGSYLPKTKKIFIYDICYLAVLVHELAHHYTFHFSQTGGHKEYFKEIHAMFLEKTQEMKEKFYNEI